MSAYATARALADDLGRATAYGTGQFQRITGVGPAFKSDPGSGIALAQVINSGNIIGVGNALVDGTTEYGDPTANEALAFAVGEGVAQSLDFNQNGFAQVTNYGGGVISGSAYAHAFAEGFARAHASGTGVFQGINAEGGL